MQLPSFIEGPLFFLPHVLGVLFVLAAMVMAFIPVEPWQGTARWGLLIGICLAVLSWLVHAVVLHARLTTGLVEARFRYWLRGLAPYVALAVAVAGLVLAFGPRAAPGIWLICAGALVWKLAVRDADEESLRRLFYKRRNEFPSAKEEKKESSSGLGPLEHMSGLEIMLKAGPKAMLKMRMGDAPEVAGWFIEFSRVLGLNKKDAAAREKLEPILARIAIEWVRSEHRGFDHSLKDLGTGMAMENVVTGGWMIPPGFFTLILEFLDLSVLAMAGVLAQAAFTQAAAPMTAVWVGLAAAVVVFALVRGGVIERLAGGPCVICGQTTRSRRTAGKSPVFVCSGACESQLGELWAALMEGIAAKPE